MRSSRLSSRLFFWHDQEMGKEFDFESLSGVWSGRYWLGEGDKDGVCFSAWVTIENGRLRGSTLEPSLFDVCENEENEASIHGHVSEDEVVFLKTYKGIDHEPGYYEGELSDCGRQILGRWYFGWPDEVSGRFSMELKTAGKNTPAKISTRTNTFK